MYIENRLPSMHDNSKMRMIAICSCKLHYQMALVSPSSSQFRIIRKDKCSAHFEGKVYVSSPPSTLMNHVRHRNLLVAGVVYGRKIDGFHVEQKKTKPSIDTYPPRKMVVSVGAACNIENFSQMKRLVCFRKLVTRRIRFLKYCQILRVFTVLERGT